VVLKRVPGTHFLWIPRKTADAGKEMMKKSLADMKRYQRKLTEINW
jgi:hypothetical protein